MILLESIGVTRNYQRCNVKYSIVRCIRGLIVSLSIILPTAASAVVQCVTADRSFSDFLQRFEQDADFQSSRIILPMVFRSGEYTLTNVMIELWNKEKLKKLDYPLMLSQKKRKSENVAETILLSTERYSEVFHDGPPESDLYRMLYKFRNIGGCWYLEEVHDKSE